MRIIEFIIKPANISCSESCLNPIFDSNIGHYRIENPFPWSDQIVLESMIDFFYWVLYGGNFDHGDIFDSSAIYLLTYTIKLETDWGTVKYSIKKFKRYNQYLSTEKFYCGQSKLAWSYQSRYGYRNRIDNRQVYYDKQENQSMFADLSQRRRSDYPLALDATICFFAEEIEKWRKYCDGLSKEESAHSLIFGRILNRVVSPRREYGYS